VFCLRARMDDILRGDFGFVHPIDLCYSMESPSSRDMVGQRGSQSPWLSLVRQGMTLQRPLGDDHVVVQIAKSLSEEDVPSDWMFSMRAWHITRVFLNGASLYDHEQRFIYKTALWAYNRTPQIGVHQYWSSRQRQDSENPPKKVVKLSSHLINAVMSSTCCNQNCFHGDCKLQVYKKAVTLVQFSMIYIFRPLKRKLHLRATSKESIFQLQYISMYKEHFFFLAKL
jgi:hypothetical protein